MLTTIGLFEIDLEILKILETMFFVGMLKQIVKLKLLIVLHMLSIFFQLDLNFVLLVLNNTMLTISSSMRHSLKYHHPLQKQLIKTTK